MTASATAKATHVEGQARAVVNEARSAAQASQLQQQAFEKANAALGGAIAAGEKAQAAFRYRNSCFVVCICVLLIVGMAVLYG